MKDCLRIGEISRFEGISTQQRMFLHHTFKTNVIEEEILKKVVIK